MFPNYNDWDYKYTTMGLIKKRAKTILHVSVLAGVATGMYLARRTGFSLPVWREAAAYAKNIAAQGLYSGGLSLMRIARQIE